MATNSTNRTGFRREVQESFLQSPIFDDYQEGVVPGLKTVFGLPGGSDAHLELSLADPNQLKTALHAAGALIAMGNISNTTTRDHWLEEQHANGHTQEAKLEITLRDKAQQAANAELGLEGVAAFNEQLQHISLHEVITHHPTNVISAARFETRKALQDDFTARLNGEITQDELKQKISDAFPDPNIPPTPEANLSPVGEARFALRFLGNAYDALPDIYQEIETPFRGIEGYEGSQQQAALHVPLAYSSWASAGDKDGNDNISAAFTFAAAVLHVRDMNTRIAEEAGQLGIEVEYQIPPSQQTPVLREVSSVVSQFEKQFNGEKDQSERDRLTENFRREINKVMNREKGVLLPQIDTDALEEALLEKIEHDPAQRQGALNLLRRVRTFGPGFGKIEYREGSDEIEEVAAAVLDEIEGLNLRHPLENEDRELSPEETAEVAAYKAEQLRQAMRQPQALQKAVETVLEKTQDIDARNPDSAENAPQALQYTTLKRLEIALANPQLVENHALADAEFPYHALALETLKEGVAAMLHDQGVAATPASLRTTPLFEDPPILNRAGEIMRSLYEDPLYREALAKQSIYHANLPAETKQALTDRLYEYMVDPEAFSEVFQEHGVTLTQEVQIAHSDTARRKGLLAARSAIHKVHYEHGPDPETGALRPYDMIGAGKEFGIDTRFYEGGSLLDPMRGGMRAPSAQIKLYNLQHYKQTVQGMDNAVYLDCAANITHHVNRWLGQSFEQYQQENGSHAAMAQNGRPTALQRQTVTGFNDMLYELMDVGLGEGEQNDYVRLYYEHPMINPFMDQVLQAPVINAVGGTGSRPAKRGGGGIEKTRAISWTEGNSHNRMFPGFMGAGYLLDALTERLEAEAEAGQALGNKTPTTPTEARQVALAHIRHESLSEAAKIREEARQGRQLEGREGLSHDQKRLVSFAAQYDDDRLDNLEQEIFHTNALRFMYAHVPLFTEITDRLAFTMMSDFKTIDKRVDDFERRRDEVEMPEGYTLAYSGGAFENITEDMRAFVDTQRKEYAKTAKMVHLAMLGRGSLSIDTGPDHTVTTHETQDVRETILFSDIPHWGRYFEQMGRIFDLVEHPRHEAVETLPFKGLTMYPEGSSDKASSLHPDDLDGIKNDPLNLQSRAHHTLDGLYDTPIHTRDPNMLRRYVENALQRYRRDMVDEEREPDLYDAGIFANHWQREMRSPPVWEQVPGFQEQLNQTR